MTTATDTRHAKLAAGLRAWAKGSYACMGAAEVLIGHRTLLAHIDGAGLITLTDRRDDPFAYIDWDALDNLGYLSGGEQVTLNFAWSMVDHEHPVDLSDLARLDTPNRLLVMAGLALAAGDLDLHAELASRAADEQ